VKAALSSSRDLASAVPRARYDRRMSRGRIVAVVSLLVAGSAIALVTNPVADTAPARILCGSERWSVKTLQDRPVLRPARTVTLRYLITRPAPHPHGSRRLGSSSATSSRSWPE
jgi:hypothetical protein